MDSEQAKAYWQEALARLSGLSNPECIRCRYIGEVARDMNEPKSKHTLNVLNISQKKSLTLLQTMQ